MHKMVDCERADQAVEIVKRKLRAAAMQVALDMRRSGYIVELEVHYMTAIPGQEIDPPESP